MLQNGQPLSANSIDKDDDEDWSMDTSKAAVKARMEKLTDGAAVLTVVDDLEKSTNERMDMFFKFVEVRPWSHSLLLLITA